MKRFILAAVLFFAISAPAPGMARPAVPPAHRHTADSVLQRAWGTLLGLVRSLVGQPFEVNDGGGHSLPPPPTSTTGG